MSSIKHSNANTTLSYNLNGSHSAQLRCKQLSIAYSVVSEESHARRHRAFYPHLRVQGTFSLTFDLIGWKEYDQAMSWFWDYFDRTLNTVIQPTSMVVVMNSRNFVRLGIPTTGVTFGDHVGSMVFSPTIDFISISDPNDSKATIIDPSSSSKTTQSAVDTANTQWFYPNSKLNSPGALQQYIYNAAQQAAATQAAAVQNTTTGATTAQEAPGLPQPTTAGATTAEAAPGLPQPSPPPAKTAVGPKPS